MAIDPVCGMQVDEKSAAATATHKGVTYYFCAVGCQRSFLKEPEKYIKPDTGSARQGDTAH